MLRNKRLVEIAKVDANNMQDVEDDEQFIDPDFDPYYPGSILRTCTRSYDKVMEKHLCNYLISDELNTQLLNRAKDSNYIIKFGCVVGRKSDKVKACCIKRTTKKRRKKSAILMSSKKTQSVISSKKTQSVISSKKTQSVISSKKT